MKYFMSICAEKGENERVMNLRTPRCESATDTDVGKARGLSFQLRLCLISGDFGYLYFLHDLKLARPIDKHNFFVFFFSMFN